MARAGPRGAVQAEGAPGTCPRQQDGALYRQGTAGIRADRRGEGSRSGGDTRLTCSQCHSLSLEGL